MKNCNFVAIDFETATHSRMACQIGIIVVENGVIVESISKFIQPPENRYDNFLINIHGITPDMTESSPTFDVVWADIEKYFIGITIIAHNASFDEDVLYKNLEFYDISHRGIPKFTCTCDLYKRASLKALCKHFNMSAYGHHDALFDAKCCAEFYLRYLIDPSVVTENFEKLSKQTPYEKLSGDVLKKDLSIANPDNPLYDKKIVVTGEFTQKRSDIGKILKTMGADIDTGITKNTNYVLIGLDAGPAKMRKMDKLIHDGYNIRKLYQDDFDKILSGKWDDYYVNKDNTLSNY